MSYDMTQYNVGYNVDIIVIYQAKREQKRKELVKALLFTNMR